MVSVRIGSSHHGQSTVIISEYLMAGLIARTFGARRDS